METQLGLNNSHPLNPRRRTTKEQLTLQPLTATRPPQSLCFQPLLSAARNMGSWSPCDLQPVLCSSGLRDCLEKSEPSSSRCLPVLSPRCLLLCFAQVLYQWCLPWQSFLCFFSPFISKELFVSFLLPDCPAVTSSSLLMFLLIRAQGGLFSFQVHGGPCTSWLIFLRLQMVM